MSRGTYHTRDAVEQVELVVSFRCHQHCDTHTTEIILHRTHLGERGLLVEEGEDAVGAALDDLQALLVVAILHRRPGDALRHVLLLQVREDLVVEQRLQLLVRCGSGQSGKGGNFRAQRV